MTLKITRRKLLKNTFAAVATLSLGAGAQAFAGLSPLPFSLRRDSSLGASLPVGASLRVVARSGEVPLARGSYRWHAAPDGGACFATGDGGWIYVSNSEMPEGTGGAGALRFAPDGTLLDAYAILTGTSRNCAGGATPWHTWLSCEENGEAGQVFECDPAGRKTAVQLPMLGRFNHETAAFDPETGQVYLTEDQPDGCLYRFTPVSAGDLIAGGLEVAVLQGNRLVWQTILDPGAVTTPLRDQVGSAARFQGGEGILHAAGKLYFTTKYDNKVWALDLGTMELRAVYDASLSRSPLLTGVDNIALSPNGSLIVAEDGGDMQLVALTEHFEPVVLLQLHGHAQSEVTGPAFSPDGRRLYFSSQRGSEGLSEKGLTYELILPEGLRM